jgi:hypothetical protein
VVHAALPKYAVISPFGRFTVKMKYAQPSRYQTIDELKFKNVNMLKSRALTYCRLEHSDKVSV